MAKIDERYKRGKIYKLTVNGSDDVYYGSTIQPLSKRIGGHFNKFNDWKNGSTHYFTAFKLFELEDPIITLVENYPCNNVEELTARERFYIENNACVNKQVPGSTRKEVCKRYVLKNPEKRQQSIANYRDSGKKSAIDKLYREKNAEKIAAKKSKPYYCDVCDCTLQLNNKSAHNRSKKHTENLNQMEKK